MEKLIIWDYNGTICDDIEHSLACINIMLIRRGLDTLSLNKYKEIFGFPVADYYKAAGFDFGIEPYKELAKEYIEIYKKEIFNKIKLRSGALEILKEINKRNIPQIILSASELSSLITQLDKFKILELFDKILGTSDIYAHSKMEMAVNYINKINPGKLLFIGDTLHDSAVADEIGADCILLSGGHQSFKRLVSSGKTVINDIKEVLNFIL